MSDEDDSGLGGFAVCELLGHRVIIGKVTEVTVAGAGFIRVDVPGPDGAPAVTSFFPPSSIYCLTPISEEEAKRRVVKALPVARVSMSRPPEFDEDGGDGFEDEEEGAYD